MEEDLNCNTIGEAETGGAINAEPGTAEAEPGTTKAEPATAEAEPTGVAGAAEAKAGPTGATTSERLAVNHRDNLQLLRNSYFISCFLREKF